MSQVSLGDLEITGLKNENKNLENFSFKIDEERKTWERKCKYLTDKKDNLLKQVTRQLPV